MKKRASPNQVSSASTPRLPHLTSFSSFAFKKPPGIIQRQDKELFSRMSSKVNPSIPVDVRDSNSLPTKKSKSGKGQAIEDIYQKKTQLEHILLRPDTYIGSVEAVTELMWVFENDKMVQRDITYVPGLYKIFDEILVNAADNKQRDSTMDLIKIDIDQENCKISICNNGIGIPVVMHKNEKMYVPTMIFGHLLTSSNFNDDDKKVTGGRNGYGAKLCNVFSTKFIVETGYRNCKKAFKQTWENNMQKTAEPTIRDFASDDYTKVTFKPDLAKFNMESLDNDIVSLFSRRAYDVAASSRGVQVQLNGKTLPIKSFKDYVDLFLKERKDEAGETIKFNYEAVSDRWEIAVAPSENGFQQNSFVNSIATTKGGRHVDYIAEMLGKNLAETIKKKNKIGIDIKPFQIRNHLWIFINCLIENPTFDSQTKENMTLQSKSFGSKCDLSDKFYLGVLKCGIVENVLSWAKYKAEDLMNKKGGLKKKIKIKGIPKLEDANDAGTKKSIDCTLILTEGDSAKAVAVAGLGIIGRDKYGVFPLRGKLLNVREATHKQILENAEINALVKILGLQYRRKYNSQDDMNTLRYGKIMIMTDQDHDGSHIKGLIINFIHHNWPSLLQMNFIEEFITPIVRARKGKKECISFYSMPELEEWKKTKTKKLLKTYKIKYYKGLGTSKSDEAKEYFTNMQRHRIKFKYQGSKDDDQITMAFSKKCTDQRKDWLTGWMDGCKRRKEMGMMEDVIYGSDVHVISFSDFINKELVLFSNLDNERSIPSLVDGLKPGQRKVIYACFKRKLKGEVKVAQLAGSIAELSAYHHGEVSLMSTIINLAQNYVGSNNINMLQPIGQFGTRLQGGKDSASARYIYTNLSPLARIIFDPKDDPILTNLFDDNTMIEPEWYCPIIPMVLVNGADGIGTGWMTKIPNYNPREVIANLQRLIRGEEPEPMKPWYKNFRGEILEIAPHRYAVNGEVRIISSEKIEIIELPVGTWTQTYKESVMEPMVAGTEKQPAVITDYKEYHTDTTVKFVISMKPEILSKFKDEGLHKVFKIQTSMNLTSMVLFDQNKCIRKYNSSADILQEFYKLRYEMYVKRREYLLGALCAEASKLTNQARFITEKCDGSLTVENKKRQIMIDELVVLKYDSDPVKFFNSKHKYNVEEEEVQEEAMEEPEEEPEEEALNETNKIDVVEDGKDFDYLLGMAMWSLTLEKQESLLKKRDETLKEVEKLKKISATDMYSEDLDRLLSELDKLEKEEEEDTKDSKKKVKAKKGFSKKADMATAPSPCGQRVTPVVDDMIKKAEAATKIKKNKGQTKRVKKEIKVENMDLDEYDLMASQNNSLVEQLNSSMGSTDGEKDLGTKLPDKKKITRKPKTVGDETRKKKGVDGLKQTKLNFNALKTKTKEIKEKSKKKYISDSSDDNSFPSDEDDFSENVCPSSTVRARTQRAAATSRKMYTVDSSDDNDDPYEF